MTEKSSKKLPTAPIIEPSQLPSDSQSRQIEVHAHAGPLPSPDDLAAYGKISPDLVDRIVKMAEKNQEAFILEQEANIQIHKKVLDNSQNIQRRGQALAFVVALAGLSASVILGISGNQWAASIIGGATIVSLVTAFIHGRKP